MLAQDCPRRYPIIINYNHVNLNSSFHNFFVVRHWDAAAHLYSQILIETFCTYIHFFNVNYKFWFYCLSGNRLHIH